MAIQYPIRVLFGLVSVCVLTTTVASCGGSEDQGAATETVATFIAEGPVSLPSIETDAELRAVFSAITEDEPGCSAAVGLEGNVVWAEGFGLAKRDPSMPITPETIFDIGSTSKQFTATAILLLAQSGSLDLDAPPRRYLSELPPWADRPTLRQMMHHQSGIRDYINLLAEQGFSLTGRATVDDALAVLGEVTSLEFEPGAKFSYSNSNYFLFSQIVEAVSGRTLAKFLKDEVFEPLDLEAVMDPVARFPEKAASYYKDGDGWVVADSLWEQTGDGGIQTTPSQLVRWASQYWDPTIGGPSLLAARTEGAVENGLGRYGAGINVAQREDGGSIFLHSGGWAGFVTELLILPDERLSIAVTCNRPDGDPTELAVKVMNAWRVD